MKSRIIPSMLVLIVFALVLVALENSFNSGVQSGSEISSDYVGDIVPALEPPTAQPAPTTKVGYIVSFFWQQNEGWQTIQYRLNSEDQLIAVKAKDLAGENSYYTGEFTIDESESYIASVVKLVGTQTVYVFNHEGWVVDSFSFPSEFGEIDTLSGLVIDEFGELTNLIIVTEKGHFQFHIGNGVPVIDQTH